MEQQVGIEHGVPKPHQVVTKQQALRMLETYFGYTSFRPAQGQRKVLAEIIS